jgi:hypothetical protein
MQVLCKSTNGNAECNCCVCGQGFVMYWERQSRNEQAEALREIQQTFLRHHRENMGMHAHPQTGFLVPEWNGPMAYSGAGLLGSVSAWDL